MLNNGVPHRWARITVDGIEVEIEVSLIKLTDKKTGQTDTLNEVRGQYGAPAGTAVH